MKKLIILTILSHFVLAQGVDFEAKGILFLTDGDHGTFSFQNNSVEKDKSTVDKIGAFLFPLSLENSFNYSEQPVSNSIFYNQKSIAIKSDSRIAYVLETRGSLKTETGLSNLNDLPEGNYVSVIDITNLKNLKPDYRFPVGKNPTAMSLSKDNLYLAVSAEEHEQQMVVFELNEFGKPIKMFSKPSQLSNSAITDIVWHPSGDFLAFIKKDTREVGLIKVVRDGPTNSIIRLDLFGNTIKMEGLPQSGLFTSDGKYFVILDKKHEITDLNSSAKGQVFVLKFDYEEALKHYFIAKAEVDENPTAMAVHPSNGWILVTNARRSFEFPIGVNTNKSSISILKLMADGNIIKEKDFSIKGILPSSIAFDKSGKNAAVSIFQLLNFGKSLGSIEFFRFDILKNGTIEPQDSRINTGKGVHFIKAVENF